MKSVSNTRASRDKKLKQGYYPRGCFLTNTNEYFICGKRAGLSCANLRKARSKALKKGHKRVAQLASEKMKIKALHCNSK
jgi:hypothetical protein